MGLGRRFRIFPLYLSKTKKKNRKRMIPSKTCLSAPLLPYELPSPTRNQRMMTKTSNSPSSNMTPPIPKNASGSRGKRMRFKLQLEEGSLTHRLWGWLLTPCIITLPRWTTQKSRGDNEGNMLLGGLDMG